MSNDTPQPENPFDDLLADLVSNDAQRPAAQPAPVVDEAAASLPASGLPEQLPPTVALPGSNLPAANAAANAPYADPTVATTVLPGGSGAGLPPVEPPTGGGPGGFGSWDPRRKAVFWVLIGVGGLLVIALAVLLTLLLTGQTPAPGPTPTGTSTSTASPSPTGTRTSTASPSPTGSRSPSPSPSPTATHAAIAVFAVNQATTSVQCPNTNASTTVPVAFSWETINATQVAIAWGPNQVDAINQPSQSGLLPQTTNYGVNFACNNAQLTFSLTVSNADGVHSTAVVTLQRTVPATPAISQWSAMPPAAGCDTPSGNYPALTLSYAVSNWVAGYKLEFGIGGPGQFYSEFDGPSGNIVGSPTGGPGSDFTTFDCDQGSETYVLRLYDASNNQVGAEQSVTVVIGD